MDVPNTTNDLLPTPDVGTKLMMRTNPTTRSTNSSGALFASPWIIGFLALFVFPFAASFYWSLCQYDMVNPPRFIGGENYERLAVEVANGDGFGKALLNTAYYSLISVPMSIAMGVVLAKFLSWPVRGQAIYRTIFFLPSIIPVVAASILWVWLLDPQEGMINFILSPIGLGSQNWLQQPASVISGDSIAAIQESWNTGEPLRIFGSKDGLILISLWGVGNWIVIYLAAMGEVPKTLYESAEIEGFNGLRKFWHITLPMLSPIIFFNLVMGLIRSIQTFTSVYIVSEGTGAPSESLLVISMHMFLSAFSDLDMGYASAIAWVLFLILVVCTLLLFRSAKYWVHYRSAI